jgi:hypothetical protein
MRTVPRLALVLTIGIVAAGCAPRPVARTAAPAMTAAAPAAAPVPEATAAPDLFESDVKPLLHRRCAPCHSPGGQMYARMPFDQPATVREHSAGILGRLKADGAVLERWLAASR